MQGLKRAIIFINSQKKDALDLCNTIKNELNLHNITMDIYPSKGKYDLQNEKNYDIAISLGGDGTVLAAARTMSPLGIPIFPVNFGTFGFIAGIQPHEWKEKMKSWINGNLSISKRLMLEINVERAGKEFLRDLVLMI